MTVAEAFAAIVAALDRLFAASSFAVWPGPPEATALPAVWPEYESSFTGSDRLNGGVVIFRLVAAIAPQSHAAEYAALYDAHDRFDTISATELGNPIAGRTGRLDVVQIGGADVAALLYSLTVARALPC